MAQFIVVNRVSCRDNDLSASSPTPKMKIPVESKDLPPDFEPTEWKDELAKRRPEQMVQYMVEEGIAEVPKRFVQPPHMRPAVGRRSSSDDEVPIIDMALGKDEEGRKQLHADIARACEEWGFFQAINHGVPDTLMDAMMDMEKKFYSLTSEEKEVYKKRKTTMSVGYGGVYDKHKDQALVWMDRLTVDLPSARDLTETYNLVIDNPPGFQEVYVEYGKAIYEFAKEIMAIISEVLGQPKDFLFKKIGDDRAAMKTAFNYYPQCPQPEFVLGLPPHADASALAILQQGSPGLEVLKNGFWIPVPPCSKRSLVVNVGDVIQMISNARFKSSLHRAVVTEISRYSIGSFIMPHREIYWAPAAELCDKMTPPIYRSVKYAEYILEYLSRGIKDDLRVVDLFRLCT